MAAIRKIQIYYGRLGFRAKLLLNFFAVNFIIMLGMAYYHYVAFTDTLYTQAFTNIDQSVQQLALDVGHVVDNMRKTSDRTVTDAGVLTAMSTQIFRRDFDTQMEDYELLRKIVNDVYSNNLPIYSTLYFKDDAIYLNRDRRFLRLQTDALPWLDEIDEQYGAPLWVSPYQMEDYQTLIQGPVVGISRTIRDFSFSSGSLGVVSVYINTRDLQPAIRQVEETCHSRILLVDGYGNVICSTTTSEIGKSLSQVNPFQNLSPQPSKAQYLMKIAGEEFLVNTALIKGNNWKIISLAPVAYWKSQNQQALWVLGVNFLLVGLLLLLDLAISASMTKRVKKLLSRVVLPDGGVGIDPQEKVEFYNELRQIIDTFADMKARNRQLTENILAEELSKIEAQLSAMQAQIDSHFLYNSLDVINWMAVEHGTTDIANMVQLLSRFYRISLAKGNEIIPLAQELEHVKTYLEIQKIRFVDLIQYHIDIEPDLETQQIAKLLLQPIVENAIVHGLMEKEIPGGTILIQAQRDGDWLRISVSDDGVGMSPSVVKAINTGESSSFEEMNASKGSNFGLRNIRARLKLYFGSQAELYVSSSRGNTTVSVVIPYHAGSTP